VIALHDCNGDVNRAINVLLEGNPDTVGLGAVNVVRPNSATTYLGMKHTVKSR